MPGMIRQCAVMVGGRGTRLGYLTEATPKPILKVGGRPFLAWLLRELARFGVEETILLTGFRTDLIRAALPDIAAHVPGRMRIMISEEQSPAGTGGALWNARSLLRDRFLVCNGDSLFAANLVPLLRSLDHETEHVLGHLMLRHVSDAARYGIVDMAGDRVISFREALGERKPAWINAGMYAFDRRILDFLSENCSLESDALVPLAASGRLRAIRGDGYFIDIGIPEDLARSRTDLRERVLRPALFLCRTSVIKLGDSDKETQEQFEWVHGAPTAIRLATQRGWQVFIVSVQCGPAHRQYSEEQADDLFRRVACSAQEAGGTIDDTRYCPHHPKAQCTRYRIACSCRPPKPGMLVDLIETWEVDRRKALVIGDNLATIQAGEAAGVTSHLFSGGDLGAFLPPLLDAAERAFMHARP